MVRFMTHDTDIERFSIEAETAFYESRALGKPRTVLNRGTERARAIIRILFAGAERSAAILCSRLSDTVYSLSSIEDLLKHDQAHIRILLDLEKPTDQNANSLIPLLFDMAKCRNAEDRLKVRVVKNSYEFHISIFDDCDVRLEEAPRDREATIVFNDTVLAKEAIEFFNFAWEHAEALIPESQAWKSLLPTSEI